MASSPAATAQYEQPAPLFGGYRVAVDKGSPISGKLSLATNIAPPTHKFMDPALLKQFRQQLASWIEARLISQRLPFQRLELTPRVMTDQGYLTPDLVLWINRDSQLAGSLILLPDHSSEQALSEGLSLAKALGLGHFTIWAAHEVSIWETAGGECSEMAVFTLPPTSRVTADDFQQTLDVLLERLKIVTVTCTPAAAEQTAHYYANLCLRTLQELAPGLTTSARLAAGQTGADAWVEVAPQEKAWLSLWRILFLLWEGRLPPGLQPERLEFAIHYALSELAEGNLNWLNIHESEPNLSKENAVRLHHLGSRLRQLGWPRSAEEAEGLCDLLLGETAEHFKLGRPQLPWPAAEVQLCIACQPPEAAKDCSIIAPRAYLAGWVLKISLTGGKTTHLYAETLAGLDPAKELTSALAILQERAPLNRKERDSRRILLRQVWPSRRFNLPQNAPAWLWDAIYLSGRISEDLSLYLPKDWYSTPGVAVLWALLSERYHLSDFCQSGDEIQVLHLTRKTGLTEVTRVHRQQQTLTTTPELHASDKPGTTQVWLKGTDQLLELLLNGKLMVHGKEHCQWPEGLTWGLFIFLHTGLGRYLWSLCGDQAALPELACAEEAVSRCGVPVPAELILSDLSLVGSQATPSLPKQELLEREFAAIFGPTPELPDGQDAIESATPRTRQRSNVPAEQIFDKVFVDGIPVFPDHYMMDLYKPALKHYTVDGPLEIVEEFFDRVLLRSPGQEQGKSIEVSGHIVAQALIYAAHGRANSLSLPEDEQVLESMVLRYRSDLQRLWDNLVRECRRFEPHRQIALNLARKIWKQAGLPADNGLK